MARKSVVRAVRTVGVAGALLAIAGGMNGAVAIVPATPVGATTPHGALSQLTLVNTRNVVTDLTKPVTTTKTQQFHSVAAQSDTAPDHVDLEWGSAPDPGHLQVVDSTPIVAGGVYQFYQGYSDGAGGHCGSPWPMEGSVIVDQVTFSPTGTLLTFAARVSCSGGADSFWGSVTTTVAYDITPTTPGSGYYLFQGTGQITGFGNDHYLSYLGDLSNAALNRPVVSMATSADGGGYWMVAGDGGVFSYGDAPFYGSMGGQQLNMPIVGMAPDGSTGGYWMVASDGGIFSFNAPFYGSMGGRHLNMPIVGMATTPDGRGYWLVAADGGVFSFGDAAFHGSTGNLTLNQPIVGMASDGATGGYWFVAADGGVFSFGAPFLGSMGGTPLTAPIVGMSASASTAGYWLTAADGGVFAFQAPQSGGLAGQGAPRNVVGITS